MLLGCSAFASYSVVLPLLQKHHAKIDRMDAIAATMADEMVKNAVEKVNRVE